MNMNMCIYIYVHIYIWIISIRNMIDYIITYAYYASPGPGKLVSTLARQALAPWGSRVTLLEMTGEEPSWAGFRGFRGGEQAISS